MAKSKVELRTAETIEHLEKWAKQPRVHKLTRFDLVAWAAGFTDGEAVYLLDIENAIQKMYVDGIIER